MGWIIALIVGGVAGWLASMVMNRDASMGIFWNIVIGCVGSVVGNLVANRFGYAGSVKEFSINGLIIALWLMTRTVGIPYFGPEAGVVEAVGVIDTVSKLVEGALIVCLVVLWRTNKPIPTQ